MNKLPVHLLDEILFRLQPTSLAKLRCVDKSLQSHISDDQLFQSKYFSRLGSTLLKISGDKSLSSSFNPLSIHYYIVGSSPGLLLLNIGGLCVVNPLTKKFKFIDHSSAKLFPNLLYLDRRIPLRFIISVSKTQIGFAVDQIDRNTQRFKIVCLFNQLAPNGIDTIYQFEIYSENSWRISQTNLICSTSELHKSTKPVYFNGCLYWLRIDGSIISFDLESEEARLIPVEFPKEVNSKVAFGVGENRTINLVSATKEKICIYVLEKEKENIRWNLMKEMENVKIEEGNLLMEGEGEIHGIEKKWKVLGSILWWGEKWRDFYMFKPCWDSVVELDEMLMMNDVVHDIYGRLTMLMEIIRIIRYRW